MTPSAQPAAISAEIAVRFLTYADADAIVALHLSVFPESLLTRLGAGATRRHYAWLLTGPHEVVPLGAFVRDKLVGFCLAGRFRGAVSGYVRSNLAYLFWSAIRHPLVLINRRVPARLVMLPRLLLVRTTASDAPPAEAGTLGVQIIGTDPAARRAGVGAKLMGAVEAIAADTAVMRLRLTVRTDNLGAARFYERLGWQPSGSPWAGEMVKHLSPRDSRPATGRLVASPNSKYLTGQ